MTLLEIIRKKKIATATDATVATHDMKNNPTVANVASVAVANPRNENINRDIEKVKLWLIQTGEPEEDHHLVLKKCRSNPEALAYYLKRIEESEREHRREKVLKMLADNPGIHRAFVTDSESDPDNVILAMAIRSVASFEMLIPKDKYDGFAMLEVIQKGLIQ